MHEKILKLAASISQAEADEGPMLAALCTAAEESVTRRLREGQTPADCGETFYCAAALLAAAGMLTCRDTGDGVEQFTAGDVSMRLGQSSGACESAAALRRQAERMMAPFWADDQFAFTGVRG